MLKRILIIASILIMGLTLFSLLNKPLEPDTAVADKEEQELSVSKEIKEEILTMELITQKIHERYGTLKFGVSTSNKELTIQVQENKDDFDSIKKDIESIAKNVIKTSPIKEYPVIVEWVNLSAVKEEHKNINKELLYLTDILRKGLINYDFIGDIVTEYQKSITIHTSLDSKGEEAHTSALEIEEVVNKILNSKELSPVSKIESYKIIILNADGKVVN